MDSQEFLDKLGASELSTPVSRPGPKFKRKVKGTNAVLNKPGHHSVAACAGSVEVGAGTHVYSTFSISDCSRVITLDLEIKNDKDYANSVFKIETLIEQLEDQLTLMKWGRKEVKRREKILRKWKKKTKKKS